MAIKARIVRLSRKEYFWIIVLTLIVLVMHLSNITLPDTVILDEFYYVNDARDIVFGNATLRGEHPPLGQLFIAGGIMLFGDNAVGWRLIAVLMGSANIFLLYLICRRLEMSRWAALIAGFLLAMENMTFVQSSVAMLDVFSLFFVFLSFWLYLRGNYPAASVLGCLGVLVKLTGGLGFIVIILHWLLVRRDRRIIFIVSMVLAPLLFFELLPMADYAATGQLVDPFYRIETMLARSAKVTFGDLSHPFATRPWEWIIFLRVMPYNFDPDYLAVISPTLWALIVPAAGYIVWRIARGSRAALFGVIWFAATYIIWIPATLVTDRMTFVYYFYPAVGSICIGLALGLTHLLEYARSPVRKHIWAYAVSYGYLGLHAAVFIALSPTFARWLPSIRSILT